MMTTTNTPPQNQSLNLLKILGAVAVVLNHLLYPVFSRADFFLGKGWWVATIFYSASVIAVPLFVIINGYLLLPKKESIAQAYRRTFHRLVVPLIFWFGFFLLWRTKYYYNFASFSQVMGIILSGSIIHYYFLVLLIGLQLLLPFWRLVIAAQKKELIHLLGIGTLIVSSGSYLISYSGLVSGTSATILTWWLPFTAYYWWGYWRKHLPKAASFYWLLTAGSMFLLIIYLSQLGIRAATRDITLLRQDGIFYWHSLVGLPVVVMSIATFEAVMNSSWLTKILNYPLLTKLINWLAPLSYGVYLMHFFVIEWLDLRSNFAIEYVETNIKGFIINRSLIVLVLSFAISYVITKLPIIKRVVGINSLHKRSK